MLRTQREGRDVRAVFIGQLHNYCLPMRRVHSVGLVVGSGRWGVGGRSFYTIIMWQWCIGWIGFLKFPIIYLKTHFPNTKYQK